MKPGDNRYYKSIIFKSICILLIYICGIFRIDWKISLIIAVPVYVYFYPSENLYEEQESKHKNLPAWMIHPDRERTEWINAIIFKLWPHLEKYLKKMFSELESHPDVRSNVALWKIKSLSFPNFSLGVVSPRITGVKVHKTFLRNELLIDMNIDYSGDLSAQVEVELPWRIKVFANLKNFLLSGHVRLHLKPLIKEIPFVGGVKISFLEKPDLDFDLGGLGSVLELPGLAESIRSVILYEVENSLVSPNGFYLNLGSENHSNHDDLSAKTPVVDSPAGVLSIKIVEAKNLENKDWSLSGSNKSDPYTVLELFSDGVKRKFCTEIVSNNLNPVWNHITDLPVDDTETLSPIRLSVWDSDSGNKDDFLGKTEISWHTIQTALKTGSGQDVWKKLEGASKGYVHVQVSWCSLLLAPPQTIKTDEDDDDANVGVLSVFIDSCSNLHSGRTGLKLPDTRVSAELGGTILSTDTVTSSVNPVYENRMNFTVINSACDCLKLTVLNVRGTGNSLGFIRLPVSDLLSESRLSLGCEPYVLKARVLQGNTSPTISLSMAFRFISRPPIVSCGVQKTMQELTKIMAFTVTSDILNDSNNNNNSEGSLNATETVPRRSEIIPSPEARSIPDAKPKIRITLKYDSVTRTLVVVVHRAQNLNLPYNSSVIVKTYLTEESAPNRARRIKHSKRKTKVKKTPNPIFEEILEYFITTKEIEESRLEVSLERIKGGLSAYSVCEGRCLVPIHALINQNPISDWYNIFKSEKVHSYSKLPSPTRSLNKIKIAVGEAKRSYSMTSLL